MMLVHTPSTKELEASAPTKQILNVCLLKITSAAPQPSPRADAGEDSLPP